MFKIKKKKLFIPIIILVLTAFLALIGYISIIFLGHYVIDEKKLAFCPPIICSSFIAKALQNVLCKQYTKRTVCIARLFTHFPAGISS